MVIRISVAIHGAAEKFLIACETGHETIQWICETAYNRYRERHFDRMKAISFITRRSTDRSLLAQTDQVGQILQDNDAIQIGMFIDR
jgi:hypothetical protein